MDPVDNYTIEFNRSVLNALKASISDIYKQLIGSGLSAVDAESILKTKIDRMAFTELCPQVFTAITKQYEMMKKPDAAMIKNGVRYDQFSWDIKDTETLDILRKNNVFLTSKYYNRLEAGRVRERIEKAFTEGKSPASIANALRFEFGDMNRGLSAYNNMFINTISHTARNFANINTYQQIGVEYSRIVVFRDELLCPQCGRMAGRIVAVKSQAKAMNDYLSVDFEKLGYEKAIEEIKKVNGWTSTKELINAGFERPDYKSDAENIRHTAKIMQPGLEVPPIHANCRCSTEAVFEIDGKKSLVLGGVGGKLKESAVNAFTPAKTIKDAEKYAAEKFTTHGASFSGVKNIDSLNRFNATLDKLFADHNPEKLVEIITKGSKSVWGSANRSTINTYKQFMNNPVDAVKSSTVDWKANNDSVIEKYKAGLLKAEENLKNDPQSYIAKHYIKLYTNGIKQYQERNLYSRHNVVYPGLEIESVYTHEFGHVLADQVFQQINKRVSSYKLEMGIKKNLVDHTFRLAKSNGDIYKVSKYASTNSHEFFAESFTVWKMGQENLPDYIIDMFKEVLK